MMTALNWQKSSFSSGDGNTSCVEIAAASGSVHLREGEEPDGVLTPHASALSALFVRIKGGNLSIR